jgi:hypothetical protein
MTEKSEEYKVDTEKPPWEESPGRALVLGELELTGKANEVMMVSVRVEAFTVEAKVQPAQYEQSRVYAHFAPENLHIHVPVSNPGQHIDGAGDVSLFGYVARYIAREVERVGFRIANERADLRTVEADKKSAKRGGVKLGNAPASKAEVL